MDIAATTTALIIAFTGSSGNMNNLVRDSVKSVMHETPTVMSVSGSGADKIRVSDMGKAPLTLAQITAISDEISRRSKCEAAPPKAARQVNTTTIELTCKRR